jgi:hypothetical protein
MNIECLKMVQTPLLKVACYPFLNMFLIIPITIGTN